MFHFSAFLFLSVVNLVEEHVNQLIALHFFFLCRFICMCCDNSMILPCVVIDITCPSAGGYSTDSS